MWSLWITLASVATMVLGSDCADKTVLHTQNIEASNALLSKAHVSFGEHQFMESSEEV